MTSVSSLSEDAGGGFHFGAGFLDRLRHPLSVEGLEQIIHGVDFESLYCVLVEGGGENDFGQGHFSVEQLLDDAEAVEAGHLHIEKNQVGIVFADEVDGFDAVLALGNDVHIADILEQVGEFVAGQLLIVHDYGGKRHERSIGAGWESVNERGGWCMATAKCSLRPWIVNHCGG